MKTTILTLFFFLLLNISYSQFTNVMISDFDYPEETSIVINPKNPNEIVAGANISFAYHSVDGGLTWTMGNLVSPYGVWGDPCVLVDTAGTYYFFHLSNPPSGGGWIDRMVCQRSTDGGQTWSDGTYTGLNGTKNQDKEWGAVNPFNNHIYLTWTQFDVYGSSASQDSSIILFSKSLDNGATWSTPLRINRKAGDCLDEDNTVEGAVPVVGPQGQIYVSWAGPEGIVFNRSLDEGETWLDTNIFVADIPGGWDYAIPGISRANGLPITCCDLSNGPYRGNIYINWSDQRNGATDTDIWFVKSSDGGTTWSVPARVNDDPVGNQQFFTWMTVDPVTGYIYFVFYDRRDLTGNMTDVYLAVSRDGGSTFKNIKITDSPFTPINSIFFGDYTGISAYNNIIRPIWTEINPGGLSIWTAVIDTLFTGTGRKTDTNVPFSLEQNYPNPGTSYTYFSYRIHTPTRITLKIMDVFGREVATICEDKPVAAGKYVEYFDISAHSLQRGIYYFSLVSGEKTLQKKMIVD